MALPTKWKEVEKSYERGSADANYWTGFRFYEGPQGADQLDAFSYLDTATWTTPEGAVMIPRRLRIIQNSPNGGSVGNIPASRIEVGYRTSYNPATNPAGSATLSVSTQPRQAKSFKDINGKIVESTPDTNGLYYRVKRGSNLIIRNRSVLIIRTAFDVTASRTVWKTICDRIDLINSDSLTKLNMTPGQLRLISAEVPKYFLYNSAVKYVPINYAFWYEEDGWNTLRSDGTNSGTCVTERRFRGTKKMPIVDSVTDVTVATSVTPWTYIHKDTGADGASLADAKMVIRAVDLEAALPVTNPVDKGARKLFYTDTFNDLVGLLWWPAS